MTGALENMFKRELAKAGTVDFSKFKLPSVKEEGDDEKETQVNPKELAFRQQSNADQGETEMKDMHRPNTAAVEESKESRDYFKKNPINLS